MSESGLINLYNEALTSKFLLPVFILDANVDQSPDSAVHVVDVTVLKLRKSILG